MSFHLIPKEHSWERMHCYPVGYFDISPFVLIASWNYRTWNLHYSWQEIPTWFFKNILRKNVYIRAFTDFYWNEEFWHAQNTKRKTKKRLYLSLLEWPEILHFTAVLFKIPHGYHDMSPYRNAGLGHCPIPQAGHWLGHFFSNTRRHRNPPMQLAQG